MWSLLRIHAPATYRPSMAITPMPTLTLSGKRVLIRQDLNAPIRNGKITSSKRIDAAVNTIRLAAEAGAKVMVMSHIGRPDEGRHDAALSLAPVAEYLGRVLDCEVKLCADYLTHPPQLADGEVTLLENVRFNVGEKANDKQLARRYAALCDVFVMDAFGTAHRAHASTHGVARYAPEACAGPVVLAELEALGKALETPRRPLVAIVGGAKVSTKLAALESLSERVDQLIPGGGIANTFIKAAGYNVGKSLFEPGLVATARALMESAERRGRPIPLPDDVVVAATLSADAVASVKALHQISDDDMIFDIGPDSVHRYRQMITAAGTILWNGPVGVFEYAQFANGTESIGRAIAESGAFSVAGGGETVAAVERFNLDDKFSCISTGGGAFLALLEGKTLPAVAVLEGRA